MAFTFYLLLTGCAQSPTQSVNSDLTSPSSPELWSGNHKLQQFFLDWQGTPYLFGGDSKSGIDCSAFVQQAFTHAYQRSLPRTTKAQVQYSVEIRWDEKQLGDLLFFKTSKSDYHVGIYLTDKQFMHASTSKGVIISRLDNPYWASTFWQVRRVTM
ncbi:TPA: hydrolase [Vibrio vulnificus]|nr:hydrolase [Vibrio sp. 05-20-BW147]HAS6349464.1 hydrolase [Vibrio vulnificus]